MKGIKVLSLFVILTFLIVLSTSVLATLKDSYTLGIAGDGLGNQVDYQGTRYIMVITSNYSIGNITSQFQRNGDLSPITQLNAIITHANGTQLGNASIPFSNSNSLSLLNYTFVFSTPIPVTTGNYNLTFMVYPTYTTLGGANNIGNTYKDIAGSPYNKYKCTGGLSCPLIAGDRATNYWIYDFTASASNFSISAKSLFDNSSISNFSVNVSGTIYSTTSGVITTGFLSNHSSLVNVSVFNASNFFNVSYLNFNVSSNLVANLSQFPILYVRNVWNGSNVSSFNVTNGGFYNTSSGLVYLPYNGSVNILVQSLNYLSLNTTLSLLPNTIQLVNLSQSVVNVSLREFDSNISFKNFTFNISGYSSLFNVSGFSVLIYPNVGSYNISSIVDNSGADLFTLVASNFSISALDNKSLALYVFEHSINVSVRDITNNASVQNFTINLSDLTDGTDKRVFVGNGSVLIPVVHHIYNLTLVDAPNFAFVSSDGSFNQSVIFNISSNVNYTYFLYKFNSVNFRFFDVDSPSSLLVGVNITLGLVKGNQTYNFSFNNGSYFVSNLTSGNWEAKYSAPDYNDNNYFFSVFDSSTQTINLYLQKSTTLFKLLLRDQNDNVVAGNILRLQQQFIALGSQFVTISECKTNDVGVCYLYIKEGVNTIYRFIVIDVDGNLIKTTTPSAIVTLSSEEKIITIRVDTGANLVSHLQQLINVYGLVSLSGNVSTFTFIDGLNAISGGCLEVSSSGSVLNTSCVSGTSGTISFNYSSLLVNDSTYVFTGFVNYTDHNQVIDVKEYSNKVFRSNVSEDDNLFFLALVFIFVSFFTLLIQNVYLRILINFGLMVGVVLLGYTALGIPVIMTFMILGLVIHWDRKSTRGQI